MLTSRVGQKRYVTIIQFKFSSSHSQLRYQFVSLPCFKLHVFIYFQLVKTMKKVDFVAFCHFIADMFQIISELSKSLQKNDLILPMAITAVRRTVDQVENLLVRPKRNGHLSAFLTALQAQVEGQEDDDEDDDDEDEDANRSAKFQVKYLYTVFMFCIVLLQLTCSLYLSSFP